MEPLDSASVRAQLTDPARARPVNEITRQEHPSAGLYSWWADDEAQQVIGAALGIDVPPLIYIGQAGATKQPSGTPSSATLGSRIAGQHAGGNIGSSTFRQTISALLATTVALECDNTGALTKDSNAAVTRWIAEHLRVATVDVEDRDTLGAIEADIVAAVDPPLNLDHVPATEHRRRLRELRRDLRSQGTSVEASPATPVRAAHEEQDWLLRIEQVELAPLARQRTSPAALTAVARLAEQLPVIRQALASAPRSQEAGLRVVFSPTVQRALQSGSLTLMGSGPEKLSVAVNSAGRVVQIGRVAPTGVGAAGVATLATPPLWPVVVAGGLALAASYAEQRWLEQTFGELRDASTDGHAIFEIVDTPYYVQMLLEENEATGWRRVLMEAVSNEYLYDHWPISSEQEAALARLGWREPFSVCSPPTRCSLEHGNWHRFVSVDDLVGPVVPALVLAALGVYGAGEGSWLNISYYCSAGIKGTPSCS